MHPGESGMAAHATAVVDGVSKSVCHSSPTASHETHTNFQFSNLGTLRALLVVTPVSADAPKALHLCLKPELARQQNMLFLEFFILHSHEICVVHTSNAR